ncbi:unnamed protein product [Lactuca saligna]|uniref:Uncharacterized protein n=1 Tax=Lactuca saligna TaxID=75948 RepID=A0AA35ZED9_LACSI|nr:unnamed protein product [Lactuca saligna]
MERERLAKESTDKQAEEEWIKAADENARTKSLTEELLRQQKEDEASKSISKTSTTHKSSSKTLTDIQLSSRDAGSVPSFGNLKILETNLDHIVQQMSMPAPSESNSFTPEELKGKEEEEVKEDKHNSLIKNVDHSPPNDDHTKKTGETSEPKKISKGVTIEDISDEDEDKGENKSHFSPKKSPIKHVDRTPPRDLRQSKIIGE